jgi:hypothetical protein
MTNKSVGKRELKIKLSDTSDSDSNDRLNNQFNNINKKKPPTPSGESMDSNKADNDSQRSKSKNSILSKIKSAFRSTPTHSNDVASSNGGSGRQSRGEQQVNN